MRGASRAAVMNSTTSLITFAPSMNIFHLLKCPLGRKAHVGEPQQGIDSQDGVQGSKCSNHPVLTT